jgi:ABC-type Mn2+/Zn2+ transport system ATPase subunit
MDPVAERDAYARLARLAHERDVAVVVISHAVGTLVRACDDLLWLDRGQVISGPPEEVVAHPEFRRLYGEIHVDGHA